MVIKMDFNSLEDLEKYLNKNIVDTLKNDVYNVVKEVQQENIQAEVYDKYRIDEDGELTEPYRYKRRYKNGGLIADDNIVPNVINNNNEIDLIVENIAKGADRINDYNGNSGNLSGEYIAELIEYGDGYNGLEYDYKGNRDNTAYQYLKSRPFMRKTVEELENSMLHVKALRNGLKSKGIEVD